jgi:DNA polymerase III epsilon subunit family exonuclease
MISSSGKLSELSFCALDLETTGINPALHRIVEVAIIRFNLLGGGESLSTLVDPGVPMPDDACAIHGISDEMVRGAPRIEDLLDDIEVFINGSFIVAHCAAFDLSFLGAAFQRAGRAIPAMTGIDTVRLSRRAYRELPNHRLDTVCRHLGIDIRHHRAHPDAVACMRLFSAIMEREDPEGSWSLNDLRGYHGPFERGRRAKKKNGGSLPRRGVTGLLPGVRVRITYRDGSGGRTVRDIEPREFVTMGEAGYLLAYCHLREDMRYFRLDRIVSIG